MSHHGSTPSPWAGSVPSGPTGAGHAPVYGPVTPHYGQAPTLAATGGARPADPRRAALGPTEASNGPGSHPHGVQPPSLATWGRRVPAFLIDQAPVLLGSTALSIAYVLFLVGLLRTPPGDGSVPELAPALPWVIVGAVVLIAGLGWDWYNRWLTAGRTGQSLGKRVLGLRLLSEQTREPIGAGNAFARDLLHILDCIALVGFFWPLWDAKRQTFADMLMSTIVLEERAAGAPPP
ncbi:MAG TPA: RDD family protein [Microlunatus sp.]|nr:RDD family protein [Microlunatus sp.]